MNKYEFIHALVCKELTTLYGKKNHDYGNSFSESFKEYGLTMPAIRLDDKFRRFKQLIKHEGEVEDESIRDTLIDLANYSIMTVMELDKLNPNVEAGQRDLLRRTRMELKSFAEIRKFTPEEQNQIKAIMGYNETDIERMDTFQLSEIILAMYGLLEKDTKPMFKK